MKLKKGFTLSEVLVTLSVVGILYAILVPATQQLSPNKTKVIFRKAYSGMEKAVYNMTNDVNAYPTGLFNDVSGTRQNGQNKFCYYITQQFNTVGSINCSSASASGNNSNFTSADGIYWEIYNRYADTDPNNEFPTGNGIGVWMIIDVNGSDAPNCTKDQAYANQNLIHKSACTGSVIPDTFFMGVTRNGRINIGSDDAIYTKTLSHASTIGDAYAEAIVADPANNQ